jgi:SSS family solute:Na+ symporter
MILAGQLIALAFVLGAVAGIPRIAGALIGGAVMTSYFVAGGLLTSAWVNLVQLVVLLVGFAVAMPLALEAVGGWRALASVQPQADYWNFWHGGASGWIYLAMLGPSFVVSPGLLQKAYGARDDRAIRLGVALNALVLMVFAFMPPLLGMMARAQHPGLASADMALPTLLTRDLPPIIGALGLAALFSAEVSTADAILFMLATSLSQDLYRKFVNPGATDRQILRVARHAAIAGGALGVLLAIVIPTVITALSIFYTLLSVSLFVPIIGGLLSTRAGTPEAMAAIISGVSIVLIVQVAAGGAGINGFTPAMLGLAAAALSFGGMLVVRRTG